MSGGALSRLAAWTVRHRDKLPVPLNRAIDRIADNPDGLFSRGVSFVLGGGSADNAPAATSVPNAPVRVFIGPTNYAGQGFLWARALERADPGIGARNLAVDIPGGFAFPADSLVPVAVYNRSAPWQQAERAVVEQFTHVLFEAERPLFGSLYRRDVRAEWEALSARGLSCAFLSHGTDVRDPRRHVATHRWSPYRDDRRTPKLQADATANLRLLESVTSPVFVSTPDLLEELPDASWCPVVVDPTRWRGTRELFHGGRPRVVHVPSMGPAKGTNLIEPALLRLADEGVIDYRPMRGVESARMPELIGEADIVLDQFRIGSYGTAACEAMAAGRVVVGHVTESVRASVEATTGRRLPIVEADPETLEDVLREIVRDASDVLRVAGEGPSFVHLVHDGEFSSRVLRERWIAAS